MQKGRSTRMNACPDDTDVGLYLLAFRKVRFSRVGNASGRFANTGSASELPEAADARMMRRKCKAIYASLYIAYIMLSIGPSKLLPMPLRGFGHGAVFLAETAMQCFIVALYYV